MKQLSSRTAKAEVQKAEDFIQNLYDNMTNKVKGFKDGKSSRPGGKASN